jgi:hypothetical protein
MNPSEGRYGHKRSLIFVPDCWSMTILQMDCIACEYAKEFVELTSGKFEHTRNIAEGAYPVDNEVQIERSICSALHLSTIRCALL